MSAAWITRPTGLDRQRDEQGREAERDPPDRDPLLQPGPEQDAADRRAHRRAAPRRRWTLPYAACTLAATPAMIDDRGQRGARSRAARRSRPRRIRRGTMTILPPTPEEAAERAAERCRPRPASASGAAPCSVILGAVSPAATLAEALTPLRPSGPRGDPSRHRRDARADRPPRRRREGPGGDAGTPDLRSRAATDPSRA